MNEQLLQKEKASNSRRRRHPNPATYRRRWGTGRMQPAERRVRLLQPARGYRVAIDQYFWPLPFQHVRERLLELGCGSAAASLCLLARVVGLDITGRSSTSNLPNSPGAMRRSTIRAFM